MHPGDFSLKMMIPLGGMALNIQHSYGRLCLSRNVRRKVKDIIPLSQRALFHPSSSWYSSNYADSIQVQKHSLGESWQCWSNIFTSERRSALQSLSSFFRIVWPQWGEKYRNHHLLVYTRYRGILAYLKLTLVHFKFVTLVKDLPRYYRKSSWRGLTWGWR